MSDIIKFHIERTKLFSSLFEISWNNKKICEHILDEYLTATPAFEGELYKFAKTKIMFVGRDLNGWDKPLGDCSTLEETIKSVVGQEGAFDTFVDERGFGDGPRKYYHKNYNFFRFIKHVLEYRPDPLMMKELSEITDISRDVRQRKMSNDRIRQITTLLYCYKHYVGSKDLIKYRSRNLREIFFRRFDEHGDYYKSSEPILTSFAFFKKVVDKWYLSGV